jgi:hypothetical protein
VVTDLAGDEQRQVIYATEAPTGCARIVARRLDGSEAWHHDFPEIAGQAPVWNQGGAILWQTGHFTDPQRRDVLVTVRRSMMHSEETALLSGVDGHEVWRRARGLGNRGVGGQSFALADFDGDGLEDLASLHPSELVVRRGSTGEDLTAMPAQWKNVRETYFYWGQAVAGDFEGTGKPTIYFATARASLTALVRPDGSLVWWDAPDASPHSLPAFGDMDGDGRIEAVALGYADGMRCYDTATGKVKWTLDVPEQPIPGGIATADVNSDGRDEVLLAQGCNLLCFGVPPGETGGRKLWGLGLPATLGPPCVADTRGDGSLSVLLRAADGKVYCVR